MPGKAALCRLLLARLALRAQDLSAARQECQSVLDQLAQLESPVLTYQTNLLMGQVEEATGNLQNAYEKYQAAREALETLRSSLRRGKLKNAFMKKRVGGYENLVKIFLSRDSNTASAEEAFGDMEQAKSRPLRDLIFLRGQPLA